MPEPKITDPVLSPNLGLYLDRARIAMNPRMLSEAWNVRLKEGRIVRENQGWGPFPNSTNAINLDGRPVVLVDNFFPSDGGQFLLFGNTTDLFEYDGTNEKVLYLTPRYETGTVSVTNGSTTVTGSGTTWGSNLKAGDYFHAGVSGQRELTATWYEISSVDSDTQITLVSAYGEATQSGINYTARKVFTGDIRDYWDTTTFSRPGGTLGGSGSRPDRIYLTNGIDPVVAWDGGGDQVYTPSLGNIEAARVITIYKNMLILANVTVSGERKPYSLRNSAIGEPENHTTEEAAELVVHDGVDPILAAHKLGDVMVLYAERSITLTQFVGTPVIFAFRSAVEGIGPIAGRAVADFGDSHTFLGPDAQYTFDGVNLRETGFHVWREVLRTMSPQRLDSVLSHFDEENGELHWAVPLNVDADPTNGPPENSYTEHYLELVEEGEPTPVAQRELPATALGYFQQEETLTWANISGSWEDQTFRWNDRILQGLFPFSLMGTATGDVYILGTKDSKAGTAITSYARTGRRPLGSVRRKGILRRVYPFVEVLPAAGYDLEVYTHLANQADGTTTQKGPFLFNLASQDPHFVTPRQSARYMELEYRTSGVGLVWQLAGWQMDVVPGGER